MVNGTGEMLKSFIDSGLVVEELGPLVLEVVFVETG